MYRRNGAYGMIEREQILDFTYFKRAEVNTFSLATIEEKNFSHRIKDNLNALGIIMVISKFMSRSPKKEIQQFTECFQIINCPRQFEKFSHYRTLQNILNIFQTRASSNSGLMETLTNYPVIYFLFNCYIRQVIKIQINRNTGVLDLMGNQTEILKNYEIELRGTLLNILADSLDQQVCVKFPGSEKILEAYGSATARMKIEVTLDKDEWKWGITKDKKNEVLPTIRSTHIITTVRTPKGLNSSTVLDTTDECHSSHISISHNNSINKFQVENRHRQNLTKPGKTKNTDFSDREKYISPRELNRNWKHSDPISFNFNFIRPRNN